jgi:quinol monooxygenase YgiN
MENKLHVKVLLKIKPECREAFERELMAIRKKCIGEAECLRFDVEVRLDDPNTFLLTETWSDRAYFENVQMKREYYPSYFTKIDPMMAVPREIHYWTPVAMYGRASTS